MGRGAVTFTVASLERASRHTNVWRGTREI